MQLKILYKFGRNSMSKKATVVVVTYGFDYGHVYTLGVFRSMYIAKKEIEANKYLLAGHDYVNREVFILDETYI